MNRVDVIATEQDDEIGVEALEGLHALLIGRPEIGIVLAVLQFQHRCVRYAGHIGGASSAWSRSWPFSILFLGKGGCSRPGKHAVGRDADEAPCAIRALDAIKGEVAEPEGGSAGSGHAPKPE